ncbi:hypothetical protein [Parendozoicomonas sp. Alg238-R29]|uniref:hypothetical protein n=1 Tax=Parendozoicomonas sp. Alg238-R29 TaxID=2993446 RepID=UPI00248F3E4D|nr:hypothetical protein [Parendozoicomonas sp. Alg238-R29]
MISKGFNGLLFAALLLIFLPQSLSATAQGGELAPPGYAWKACGSLECHFLVPSGWSFESLTDSSPSDGVMKYQMLKQRHGRKLPPKVSINILQGAEVRTGLSPKRHMELFMVDLSRSARVLETWKNKSGVLVSMAATSLHFSGRKEPVKKFNLLIGNERTGTLYVLSFESQPGYWENDWSVVEQIFSQLRLDDRV